MQCTLTVYYWQLIIIIIVVRQYYTVHIIDFGNQSWCIMHVQSAVMPFWCKNYQLSMHLHIYLNYLPIHNNNNIRNKKNVCYLKISEFILVGSRKFVEGSVCVNNAHRNKRIYAKLTTINIFLVDSAKKKKKNEVI